MTLFTTSGTYSFSARSFVPLIVCGVVLLVAIIALCWMFRLTQQARLEAAADRQVDASLVDRLMNSLYVERVIVTLRTGEAFGGLLTDLDDRMLNLREAFSLPSRDTVDGDLLIPRADVLYLQKP